MTRNTVGSEDEITERHQSAHSPATRPFGAGVEPTLGFEPRTCCLGIGKITPSRNLDPAPEVVVEPTLDDSKIADACDDYCEASPVRPIYDD